jgi:hypothetical protein
VDSSEQRPVTLEEVAYHEAGHAVMRYLMDHLPGEVSIIPDDDSLGRVCDDPEWAAFEESLLPQDDDDSEWARFLWAQKVGDQVRILLAGTAAQTLLIEDPDERRARWMELATTSGWDDVRKAVELAGYIEPRGDETPEQGTERYLVERGEEVYETFNDDQCWTAVEALAQALMQQRTMSGPEVRFTIYRALGR